MLAFKKKIEPLSNGIVLYGPGKGLKKITFQALNSAGKRITKIATIDTLKKKIILIQPSEEQLYLSGIREKGVSGYIYLYAHATSNSIQGMPFGTDIADVIQRSGVWNGEPILIDACNAGSLPRGIASSLASSLRTYVTAPTTTTWNFPLGGRAVDQGAFEKLPGKLAALPFPDLTKPGQWRTWGPDGALISTSRTSPRDQLELPRHLLPNRK